MGIKPPLISVLPAWKHSLKASISNLSMLYIIASFIDMTPVFLGLLTVDYCNSDRWEVTLSTFIVFAPSSLSCSGPRLDVVNILAACKDCAQRSWAVKYDSDFCGVRIIRSEFLVLDTSSRLDQKLFEFSATSLPIMIVSLRWNARLIDEVTQRLLIAKYDEFYVGRPK